MELTSLHPFDEAAVRDFVAAVRQDTIGAAPPSPAGGVIAADGSRAIASILRGEERGRHELTLLLARHLAALQPTFVQPGLSLSAWEARIDRGIGMLMRPPARLLIDAGLDPAVARTLPIRLDQSRGMMGGAYIPARLVPDLERLLEHRFSRIVRRMVDAELDPVATFGLMLEVTRYAREHHLAIFEAMDVVTPEGDAPGVPGARVVMANRKRLGKALVSRIEAAAKPPKQPGLFSRLTGRAKRQPNGMPEGEGGPR